MGNTRNYFKKKKDWSKIKDELLGSYLKLYFQKVLTTGLPIIYIDAFAGKGLFDDGEKGSPLIALELSDFAIQNTKGENKKIEHYFIEYCYSTELKNNVKNKNVFVIAGNYENNIMEILENNKGNNIFLYVDPFGIKNLHFDKFNLLEKKQFYSVELLLNLNSFGFLREGCRLFGFDGFQNEGFVEREDFEGATVKNTTLNMNKVANGDYWQSIINDYKSGYIDAIEAEERFVIEYCQQLEEIFEYVVNIPLKAKKLKNMPKYRMIFGSNSKHGLIEMSNNMFKRWKDMQEAENNGQLMLFEMDRDFKGNYMEFDYAKIVFENLEHEYMRYDDFICKVIKKYGVLCDIKKINDTIKSLEKTERINVLRVPSRTKGGRVATWVDWKLNNKKDLRVRLKNGLY